MTLDLNLSGLREVRACAASAGWDGFVFVGIFPQVAVKEGSENVRPPK